MVTIRLKLTHKFTDNELSLDKAKGRKNSLDKL